MFEVHQGVPRPLADAATRIGELQAAYVNLVNDEHAPGCATRRPLRASCDCGRIARMIEISDELDLLEDPERSDP